jgi:SAM-dependent methyltransferase
MHSNQSLCPLCGSTRLKAVITIQNVPVYCNVLWTTPQQALGASRAHLDLYYCQSCDHIFNSAFDSKLIDYAPSYENALHFSAGFCEYAQQLALQLVQRYNLYSKTIVEVGCGDGYFLSLLCEAGANRGVGYDPSCQPCCKALSGGGHLTLLSQCFDAKNSAVDADLVVCRHVLEHIPKPRPFLADILAAAGRNATMAIYCEVPDVTWTLKDRGIWDLIYEHCNYFGPASLRYLFEQAGLRVDSVQRRFGGQFLSIEALYQPLQSSQAKHNRTQPGAVDSIECHIEPFAHTWHTKVSLWREHLSEFKRGQQRIALWGAGSKGVTFLNVLGASDHVGSVVDVNKRKWGKYLPGTAQEVLSPQALRTAQPDSVLVMNRNYLPEIELALKSQNIICDVLTV